MGIKVTTRSPEGHLIEVPAGLLDLDKRIKDGAPEYDWAGDPRMFIRFNTVTEHYQVWRACEDGLNRIISTIPMPVSAPEVLRHLGEIDSWSRRNDNAMRDLDKYNARIAAEHERHYQEMTEFARDMLEFALKRSHMPGYHDIKGSYGVGSISKHLPNPGGTKRRG